MSTGARLDLALPAFSANVRRLVETVRPARTMVAVKADAYGHGMLPFARAALDAGADSLAVLEVPAGLALRQAGVTARLFAWLHGARTDFRAAVEAGIDLGVSSVDELERIVASGADAVAQVHLKIDTGLHRNGATAADWPALVAAARRAEQAGSVRIAALWSHLADASPGADADALAAFRDAVEVARGLGVDPPEQHLAASSAGIRMPEARLSFVRFGIAAYGISPFDDVDGRGLGLRGVITMRAQVLASGGGRSVLDLGSADGVPPSVTGPSGSPAAVLLHGERRAVLAVDVDTTTVAGPASPGDEAIVFGPGDDGEPTAEEWAAWAGTIGDEIVARASDRIPRILHR